MRKVIHFKSEQYNVSVLYPPIRMQFNPIFFFYVLKGSKTIKKQLICSFSIYHSFCSEIYFLYCKFVDTNVHLNWLLLNFFKSGWGYRYLWSIIKYLMFIFKKCNISIQGMIVILILLSKTVRPSEPHKSGYAIASEFLAHSGAAPLNCRGCLQSPPLTLSTDTCQPLLCCTRQCLSIGAQSIVHFTAQTQVP